VKIKNFKLNYLLVAACFALFILLLLKNPFSTRNLIGNLEPYPDTIHYLSPAINFTNGEGFYIERGGRIKNPNVPLLYSVSLMPVFLFTDDPRAFYLVNIFLALLSLGFLYKISSKIFANSYITFIVMFLYITNYFVYWYPNLAMAENLIIPIFLGSVWLLLEKVSIRNVLIAGFLVVSFYATKYATIPLSFSLFLLYGLKLLIGEKNYRLKYLSIFLIWVTGLFSAFALFEYLTKGFNILNSFGSLYSLIFSGVITGVNSGESAPSNPWFSLKYLSSNLNIYLDAVTGSPMRFLWDSTPLVPKFVGIFGISALIFGLFTKKFRYLSFSLLLFLFSQILFMSTFYSTDARYIYHAIPLLLISFGLFLKFLSDLILRLSPNKGHLIFYSILILIFAGYLLTSAYRIKYQVALNLKHTESPWYYISVDEANKYFDTLPKTDKKPILITALPPYYVDYFSKDRYTLLPLSLSQEFQKEMPVTWGDHNFTDLLALYSSYMNNGYSLYISNYGLGNEDHLHKDFDKIKAAFNIEKVHEGCFNACNIFKLNPPQ
jgi:hypothetical protein